VVDLEPVRILFVRPCAATWGLYLQNPNGQKMLSHCSIAHWSFVRNGSDISIQILSISCMIWEYFLQMWG
jgi:hypothetical protein